MKILFTGASSFTGFWFVKALVEAGHEVIATYQQDEGSYTDVRAKRVEALKGQCLQVFGCSFGSDTFFDLLAVTGPIELFCHHAADVRNYQSVDFDVAAAVVSNTLNCRRVLQQLAEVGCNRVIATGSIFEPEEGQGSDGLPAFSPYGLSKTLTSQLVSYYAETFKMHFGKFVIPNPFGPLEDPRFTAYLVNTWAKGETPEVRTPEYTRDNIHVGLLALCYVQFAEKLPSTKGQSRLNPSGYIESQGAFAERFAANLRVRSNLPCAVSLGRQTEFPEPRIRINQDPATSMVTGWSETQAWDDVWSFYKPNFTSSN